MGRGERGSYSSVYLNIEEGFSLWGLEDVIPKAPIAPRSIDEAAEAAVFIDVEMESSHVGKTSREYFIFTGIETQNFEFEEGGRDFGTSEVQ